MRLYYTNIQYDVWKIQMGVPLQQQEKSVDLIIVQLFTVQYEFYF